MKKVFLLLFAAFFGLFLNSASMAMAYESRPRPEIILRDMAIDHDIESVIATAEQSVDEFAVSNGLPKARWVNIAPRGVIEIPEDCGRIAFSRTMFGFCRPDRTVYIGADMATMLREDTHPLSPAVTVAHEFGHHLQLLQGWTKNSQTLEDGADCVAGAWLAWFNERSDIKLSSDDFMGLSRLIILIAKNGESDVHGTAMDRGLALIRGYLDGLRACNIYTPTIS